MKAQTKISLLVDNDSWILPWAEALQVAASGLGFDCVLVRNQDAVSPGFACFLVGCTQIVSAEILQRNQHNLVVHESALPLGKGFSPMTWQILEGKSLLPICLFEAQVEMDAGRIYYQDKIRLAGHELCDEWRALQGAKTVELCLKFLREFGLEDSGEARIPSEQQGEPTYYPRRTASDSELDIDKTLKQQMDMLRVVDNDRYPAFFRYRDCTYVLRIEKEKE